MNLKQINEQLNFNFYNNLELTNSLKTNCYAKCARQFRKSLEDVNKELKESFQDVQSLMNSLNQTQNPFLFNASDELMNRYKELELLNRKMAFSLKAKHLSNLNDQKMKLSQLIDQLLINDSLFKNDLKNVKLNEDKQTLFNQFSQSLNDLLEQLLLNDELFMNTINKDHIGVKIKKEYLANLMPVIEESAKQRISFIDEFNCDQLKVLFNKAVALFEEESKKIFRAFYKSVTQLQKDQFDNQLKDKNNLFTNSLNCLKAKMCVKLEDLEHSFNDQIKNQLDLVFKELNARIATAIQKTSDSILEESRLLFESNKLNHPKKSNYQDILNELFSFNEFLDYIQNKAFKKHDNLTEFKNKLKELFTKIASHKFTSNELALIKESKTSKGKRP